MTKGRLFAIMKGVNDTGCFEGPLSEWTAQKNEKPVKTQPQDSDQRGENMAEFKTDIEIAQESQMMPITEIAKIAGVDDKYLEQYGKYKAKVDYNILKEVDRPNGKLVLVTAINPTPAGEVVLQWRRISIQVVGYV